MITDQEILEDCYNKATGCSAHPDCVPLLLEDVVEIIEAYTSRTTRYETDASSHVIVKLKNGNYGTAMEQEDYTGHG